MSFARRIIVINSFLVSLFSFVNRFFYMPTRLLHFVENQLLFFMSHVAFTPLGVFAHLRKLYGITTELRDLRLDLGAGRHGSARNFLATAPMC